MVTLWRKVGAFQVKDLGDVLETDICIQSGTAVDQSDWPTAEYNFLLNKHCLF